MHVCKCEWTPINAFVVTFVVLAKSKITFCSAQSVGESETKALYLAVPLEKVMHPCRRSGCTIEFGRGEDATIRAG